MLQSQICPEFEMLSSNFLSCSPFRESEHNIYVVKRRCSFFFCKITATWFWSLNWVHSADYSGTCVYYHYGIDIEILFLLVLDFYLFITAQYWLKSVSILSDDNSFSVYLVRSYTYFIGNFIVSNDNHLWIEMWQEEDDETSYKFIIGQFEIIQV